MRVLTAFCYCLLLQTWAQSTPSSGYAVATGATYALPINDSSLAFAAVAPTEENTFTLLARFMVNINHRQPVKSVIGFTRHRRPVEAYYFPGTSTKNALVIAGMHGSELSAISVARTLINNLQGDSALYYNVIVIPTLFPDNIARAEECAHEIGSPKNIGRYTHAYMPDPNRQMPSLGKPYNAATNADHLGRCIEYENSLLLQLIQQFGPQRIINLHAIRDTSNAGIYADPRTDASGCALEFTSDSSLAIAMASAIHQAGGQVPGNRLTTQPSAVYYKDPPVVAPGQWQPRSSHGSLLPAHRGAGVSLGSWASTAVYDSTNSTHNRAAIRLLTVEFPGYKRPADYAADKRPVAEKETQLYAAAIQSIFLRDRYTEE